MEHITEEQPRDFSPPPALPTAVLAQREASPALACTDEQPRYTGEDEHQHLIDLRGESRAQLQRAEAIRELAWCMVVRELYERTCRGWQRHAVSALRARYLEAFNERPYASFWISWYVRLLADDATGEVETDTGRHSGKPYR